MSLRNCMRHYRWQALSLTALVLAGCGSVPQQPGAAVDATLAHSATSSTSVPAAASEIPVLPPAGSGRGGYYQDDGPGDSPPAGLLQVPDAEPRVEPYASRGNRPYVVFGKRYVPILDDRPYKERGIGSWYGKKFQGQRTSSGELYDMYKMTAAHPTLPIPSYARVTNLANGKQVIVRINDRGPFHPGRIIDLSYTAALKLGYLGKGSSELEVERLLPDEIERMAAARKAAPPLAQQTAPGDGAPPVAVMEQAADEQRQQPGSAVEAPLAVTAEPAAGTLDNNRSAAAPTVVSSLAPPNTGDVRAPGFYLQFGTYSEAQNAEVARSRLQRNVDSSMPPVEVAGFGLFYRVYSGPYASRDAAVAAARRLQNGSGPKPLVVQR